MKKTAEHRKLEAVFKTRGKTVTQLCEALQEGHKALALLEGLQTEQAAAQFQVAAECFMVAADSLHQLRELEKAL